MNHVAILPEEKWPKGIFINWWVIGKGSKISKSKGGAEPIPQAMEKYGVDAMRLYYAHIGSPHADVVWEEEVVFNYKNSLERNALLFEKLRKLDGKKKIIDDWLISRLNRYLRQIDESMKTYHLRELSSIVYFSIPEDLKWYLRRGGENKKVIHEFLNTWCRLMNPLTPHISEELAESKELISISSWPHSKEENINRTAEAGENLVKSTLEGMRNVLSLAKLDKPQKYKLFIAEDWLYELFNIISAEIKITRNPGEIMKTVLAQEGLKVKGKEISRIVLTLIKDPSKIPLLITSQEDELMALKEAKDFLKKEFNCNVEISASGDHPKAKSALPGKVGIVVE